MLVVLALGIAVMAQAQGRGHSGWGRDYRDIPPVETVTVSGSLTIVQGSIAVKDGDATYLVGGLFRFAGFIDGLKEGAQVKIEGKAVTSPQDSRLKFLRPSKMTLNGRDYDLASSTPAGQLWMHRQQWPGFPSEGRRRGRH